MLTSLFGQLADTGPGRKTDTASARSPESVDRSFAVTAFLDEAQVERSPAAAIDRHTHELIALGSPAQAIRQHFATSRADLDKAGRLITLLDLSNVWAGSVVKALSDAGGLPLERLHLREALTLRSLALVERASLVRRQDDETVRVMHVSLRAQHCGGEEITHALMECSHLTAVIVSEVEPDAVQRLLQSLLQACYRPAWRCPHLLFMLPPNAGWIAAEISAQPWPDKVRLHQRSDALVSASSVWNAVLAHWSQVKMALAASETSGRAVEPSALLLKLDASPQPELAGREPCRPAGHSEGAAGAVRLADPVAVHDTRPMAYASPPTSSPAPPDRDKCVSATELLRGLPGVLACALVDSASGLVLHGGEDISVHCAVDLALAASTAARLMRAQRQAALALGLPGPVRETTTRAGFRHLVLRPLASHSRLFLMVLLDRQQADMVRARKTLADAEKALA